MDFRSWTDWIEQNMEDISAGGRVAFALTCSCCHQTYRTFPVRADPFLEPVAETRAQAHRQAVEDFSQILSRCPLCGRYVCGECIVIDGRGHLCRDCASPSPAVQQGGGAPDA